MLERIRTVFIGGILVFMAYVGIRILMHKTGIEPPPRSPKPRDGAAPADTSSDSWGLSGVSSSDGAASDFTSASSEAGGDGGSDSGGGGGWD